MPKIVGAYELTGQMEREYSPFFMGAVPGETPNPATTADMTPPEEMHEAETGLQDAAMAAACSATGGIWNQVTRQCIRPTVDTTAIQQCADAGGAWDSVALSCKIPSTARPESNVVLAGLTAGELAIAAVAVFAAGMMLSSKMSKRR